MCAHSHIYANLSRVSLVRLANSMTGAKTYQAQKMVCFATPSKQRPMEVTKHHQSGRNTRFVSFGILGSFEAMQQNSRPTRL